MRKLSDVINTHFRIMGGKDNLPIMGRSRHGGGRAALAKVMLDMGVTCGLEIGTRWGHSAQLWCDTIPGLKLTCIDPYLAYHTRVSQEKQDAVYEGAVERLAKYDVEIMREKSQDVSQMFEDGSLDFINIDGDHKFDAAVTDIIQYVPKVRKGGLILIHDYCVFKMSGVMQAVNSYTHCHRIDPWYVTKDDNPTVFWERGAEIE